MGAYIPLAIVTGKNAATLWHLFYVYCGLVALGLVAVSVQNYYKAGGHLKNKAWQLYRALAAFAKAHPQPFAITVSEKTEAKLWWVRTSGQYAKTLAPRVYKLRDDLRAHGWAAAPFWDRGDLTHPQSVDDIRRVAEELRVVTLRLP